MTDVKDSLLDLDDTTDMAARRAAAEASDSDVRPLELDLEDCRVCGARRPLNDESVCRACYGAQAGTPAHDGIAAAVADDAAAAAVESDLAAIAASSVVDPSRPTYALGSIRDDRAGFIAPTTTSSVEHETSTSPEAIANQAAIREIRERARRQREGAERMRVAALQAAEAEFAAKDAREGAIVPVETKGIPHLKAGDLVAGAAAAGHGVLVGWKGDGDMTRAKLVATLARAGLPIEWAPDAASARAQAGRAVGALGSEGYDVSAEKKSKRQTVEVKPYDNRWTVGNVNHEGTVGDKFGEIVLVVTLTGDELEIEGDPELAARVKADYAEKIGQELYRSSDVTTWLYKVLRDELDAVRFGVGWYVPRTHAATAARLCEAFSSLPWGADWIVPALPVATSEQLRSGILRGLSDEVAAVMNQLENERVTAVTKENRQDIGQKRATTFLRMLREIGGRVVAYGALLGDGRVSSLRSQIQSAIEELESSMSEDDAALVARFANIWDEIELDRRRNGGVI